MVLGSFIAGGALGPFIGALLGYMIAGFSIVLKREDDDDGED